MLTRTVPNSPLTWSMGRVNEARVYSQAALPTHPRVPRVVMDPMVPMAARVAVFSSEGVAP